MCLNLHMPNFEKHQFSAANTHGLIGSFIDAKSVRHDTNVEIAFSQLEPGFSAAPHIHTETKTVVIVLAGSMTFALNGEHIKVEAGEYIVFQKGVTEEVISVEANTQNLTIHTPSVQGGDKQPL